MHQRQQPAERTRKPFQPLHTPLMRSHPLFQLMQPPRLADANQRLHLAFKHRQLLKNFPLKIRQIAPPSFAKLVLKLRALCVKAFAFTRLAN
jgi:hypothetical protein